MRSGQKSDGRLENVLCRQVRLIADHVALLDEN
jgi:hypothetical protein